MEDFKSVWREGGVWFALALDGTVYELSKEQWTEGELVSPAQWVFSEVVNFPSL